MNDWIPGLIDTMGYVGIALLMMIENVFPPLPSEVIIPLAGHGAANGDMSLPGVIVAGSIGSLAGAYLWYLAARWLGGRRVRAFVRRHGRWLTLNPSDIDRINLWFDRFGGISVLLGRLIPTVRTLISVPAGVFGMPHGVFLLLTGIGTTIWTTVLAGMGYWLGTEYDAVGKWLSPVSTVIIAVLAAIYIYRVVTFRPES